MANHRARRGRKKPQARSRPSRQREGQIGIPAAGGVVVDADPVEAGILALRDERGDVGKRPTDRNPKSDADPGHRSNPFIPSNCMPCIMLDSLALVAAMQDVGMLMT